MLADMTQYFRLIVWLY